MARRRRLHDDGTCVHVKNGGRPHHPPRIDPQTGAVWMDWSTHAVGRRSGRCRCCHRNTIMRDCHGDPLHKVCAEVELARDLRIAAAERAAAERARASPAPAA